MRAFVTVIGTDKVGIIAKTSCLLAEYGVNILDISQTVLQEYFVMMMLVDATGMKTTFGEMQDSLNKLGEEMSLSIRIQREDIFQAMHRI
ncbi:MAG: ACT domain-containing protein [Christensenellales bacterium]|jgi:ACT domain-containing protein